MLVRNQGRFPATKTGEDHTDRMITLAEKRLDHRPPAESYPARSGGLLRTYGFPGSREFAGENLLLGKK